MFEAPPNYTPPPMPRPSAAAPDYTKALQWSNLRHANFKLNQLNKIDESLVRTKQSTYMYMYTCVHVHVCHVHVSIYIYDYTNVK